MKKILMYLQLSRINKKTKKFNVSSDSNFNFNKHIINSLSKDNEVTTVLPYDTQESKEELERQLDSKIVYMNLEKNVFKSRFFFNEDLRNNLENEEYDVIYNNDPSLAMNFRVLSPKSKIISYNHWLDVPSDRKTSDEFTYSYRQLEAAYASDFYVFNSDFAINLFKEELLNHNIYDTNCSFLKLPPLVNEEKKEKINNDKVKVLFNHRLSTLSQYKENYMNFIDVVEEFQKKYDFEVHLTNPDSVTLNDNFKRIDFFEHKELNNEKYKELVENCNASLSLFNYKGMWSMSIAELIFKEYNVLFLNHSGYSELIGDSYSKCEDGNELKKKFEALLKNSKVYEKENIKNRVFALENYSLNSLESKLKIMIEGE